MILFFFLFQFIFPDANMCVCEPVRLLSMRFSRQEYWNGVPFPPPGDLPFPGIEPMSPASPALAHGLFITVIPGKPDAYICMYVFVWWDVHSSRLCIQFISVIITKHLWASLVAQLVKNLSAVWETWIQSLGWKIPWRRERLPTPVFWSGEFHGLYSPWGHQSWT